MTNKLRLLNAVLLLSLAIIGRVIWKRVHDARMELALLHAPLVKTDFPIPEPMPNVAPLKAASYLAVAEGNLLSPDRNPTITLEPPAKGVPPPSLPLLSGVILLADSPPTVLLSARSGTEKRVYHAGERMGDWSIDSIDGKQIVLDWQGNKVTKRISELMDRSATKAQVPTAPKEQTSRTRGPQQSAGN